LLAFTQGALGSPATWAGGLAPQLASWRASLKNISLSSLLQPASTPLGVLKNNTFPSGQIDPQLQSALMYAICGCIFPGDTSNCNVADIILDPK
jgi:hypothetical protein